MQMIDSYWNEFGCRSVENGEIKWNKTRKARQCASERMAEMKNKSIDNVKNARHIYPIKHAYNLGFICASDPQVGISNKYKQQFRSWYNTLIDSNRTSPRHITFQQQLGNGDYPLENPTHRTYDFISEYYKK